MLSQKIFQSVLYRRKNIRTYWMVRATDRTNVGTQDSYPPHFCNRKWQNIFVVFQTVKWAGYLLKHNLLYLE